MQNEAIIQWIDDPSSIRPEDITHIESMLAAFPWFTPLRLLHLKGLHQNKSYQFNHALKRSAIQTPDREQLYELIYASALREKIDQPQERTTPVAETTQTEEKAVVESPVLERIEEKTEPAESTTIEETSEEAPSIRFGEMIGGPKKDLEPKPTEADVVSEESKKTDQVDDLLEKTILQHAVSSGFILGYGDPEDRKEVEKKEDTKKVKEPSQFSEWLEFIETRQKDGHQEGPEKQFEIIESFISKGSEKLSKASKDALFSPTNISKMNVVEDEAFVTETLASIYAKQGNFAKAIRAYQALMLKYPEKKAYFAALIKEIEQKK